MSGFVIVHRYAYVLLPREGDPTIIFPAEARYVGEHGTSWIEDQVFVERPGKYIGDRLAAQRVGVYGLDYVMAVRDFEATHLRVELVPFDVEFDLARAVKSDEEIESVRDSVRINTEGFWAFLEAYAPGKIGGGGACSRGAALRGGGLRPADDEHGARRRGVRDGPQAHDPRRLLHPVARDRRARAATGSRFRARLGKPNAEVSRMLEAYEEYFEAAKPALRPGATAHDVHRAVSKGFTDRGYHLGHVTGHSIGMTMIEHPKIGEGDRDGAPREHGLLDASTRHRRQRASTVSTCRTRGSSPPTAASRSRDCRCGSSRRARPGPRPVQPTSA